MSRRFVNGSPGERANVLFDQLHARRFGQANPIPSMQLCIEPVDRAGGSLGKNVV